MTFRFAFAGAALALAGLSADAQDRRFVSIGTGGVTGVYYPLGGAICELVNRDREAHGVRCSAQASGGTVGNIRALRAGEIELGLIQSDAQDAAVAGRGAYTEGGPYPELRALFSVHAEPVHLMARADADIGSVEDLRGKRVNLANPGSGVRALAETLLDYAGIAQSELGAVAALKSSEQAAALCDGEIDASIWAAGAPNASTAEATETCGVSLVPLDGPAIDRLVEENPAYSRATIPGGTYEGVRGDVPSWGPKAVLVASADLSAEVVYTVVSAVFDDFEDFKSRHPAFSSLTETEMIEDALRVDLHPGAARYYEERGWM